MIVVLVVLVLAVTKLDLPGWIVPVGLILTGVALNTKITCASARGVVPLREVDQRLVGRSVELVSSAGDPFVRRARRKYVCRFMARGARKVVVHLGQGPRIFQRIRQVNAVKELERAEKDRSDGLDGDRTIGKLAAQHFGNEEACAIELIFGLDTQTGFELRAQCEDVAQHFGEMHDRVVLIAFHGSSAVELTGKPTPPCRR